MVGLAFVDALRSPFATEAVDNRRANLAAELDLDQADKRLVALVERRLNMDVGSLDSKPAVSVDFYHL